MTRTILAALLGLTLTSPACRGDGQAVIEDDDDQTGTPAGDLDQDGYSSADGDCNDENSAIHPGVAEACDGVDQDCDGEVDEGFPLELFYPDADGDGWAGSDDASNARSSCYQPAAYVLLSDSGELDCDDEDAEVFPGQVETCNEVDDNCSGWIDEGVNAEYFPDNDGDGYGSSVAIVACEAPAGYSTMMGDCNDSNAAVYRGAPDTCDGVDSDCFGPSETDDDGDGYLTCEGDCDDVTPENYPGAVEVCDLLDNDCDGHADEDWDQDLDGVPIDAVECGFYPSDCNDEDPAIYPGADEVCDEVDNDCSGAADENLHADLDGDGESVCEGDCDDGDPEVNEWAEDICDGVDDNCDGVIDPGCF